jgi:hypothetical protein
MIDRPN